MPQNGQTHLKNLAVNTARLLKSLRPLFRHCKLEWKHLETTLYESLEKELVSQTCMIRYYYSHLSSKNLHKILLLSSLDHSKPKHTIYQRQQYFKLQLLLDLKRMTTGKCEICLMVTIARTEWPQPYWSCVLIVVLNKIWGNLFCVYIVKYKQASQIVVCVCVVTLVSVLLTMDKFHTFFLFLHCSFSKSFTHCSNFFWLTSHGN